MAGIKYVAIPGLTWDSVENKAYYESRVLRFEIGFVRDVDFWTYLSYWTDIELKIDIISTQNTILSSDETWRTVGDTDFIYDPEDGNYGRYSFIQASRMIEQISDIDKIVIKCKRKNAGDNDYYTKTLIFQGDTFSRLYSSISIRNNNTFQTEEYTNSYRSPIYASKTCSVLAPDYIKAIGTSYPDRYYTNSKYHDGLLELSFSTIEYLGELVYPDAIEISSVGYSSEKISIPSNSTNLSCDIYIGKEQQIIAPYKITLYVGNAKYEKQFTTGIYPLSAFVEQELDLSELKISAYDVDSMSETDNDYSITQRSLVSGKIKLKDSSISPYDFNIDKDNKKYYINIEAKSKYNVSQNIITLENNIPFGTHTYNSVNGWEVDNPIFFEEKTGNYVLKIKANSKFNSELIEIEIPIDQYINYSAAPIMFDKALEYQITYVGDTYKDVMILNPKENLRVAVNEKYIFFPALKSSWDSSTFAGCSYQILYVLSNQQNPSLNEGATSISYPYFNFHENIIENEKDTYTKFLKFGLKVTQGPNSSFKPMEVVRIGRVQPMQISSCQIKGGILTYYLSDYGGDKTAELPASTFIPYDSSLSRSGEEYLTLVFKDADGNQLGEPFVIDASLLGSKEQARKQFYENVPIKLPLSLWTTDSDKIARISQIEGTYCYSYSKGQSGQTVSFTLYAEDIDNVTNNPTWALRKNGVIINGKPGQRLTPVSNTDETAGTYFVEINALDNADRIIINFPGNVSAEIYCKDEKVCLSSNIVIGDTGISLADIALALGST